MQNVIYKISKSRDVEPPDPVADNRERRERHIAFYARHGIVETGYGFSMDGVPYSVLASNPSAIDPKAYSDMLSGISLSTSA